MCRPGVLQDRFGKHWSIDININSIDTGLYSSNHSSLLDYLACFIVH